MPYVVFARKWRPKEFDEVVGQQHITTTLKNAITQDRVAHAYLFSGPRGIGKTTTARIFAKALNCLNGGPTPTPCNKCESCIEINEGRNLDVIEIDAASNRGVDEVRQLRENVKFKPTRSQYKVYIIDEVHMLTSEAFNALLKTLEEPPKHIKFIFATTQRHKVIPTIISRCQRFDFKRIPTKELISKMKQILKAEKLQADETALFSVAKIADGSMRDAESILDQLVSFCRSKITADDVVSLLGTVNQQTLSEIMRYIIDKDTAASLELVDTLINAGTDITQFMLGLIERLRNIIVAKALKDPAELINLSKDAIDEIRSQSGELELQDLLYIFNMTSNAYDAMRRSPYARIQLEMLMVRLTKRESIVTLEKILGRLSGRQPPETPPAKKAYRPPADRQSYGAGQAPQAAEEEPEKSFDSTDVATAVDEQEEVTAAGRTDTKTDAQDSMQFDRAKKAWPEILQKIKQKKMSAALFLFEGRPAFFHARALTIHFAPQFVFYKEALERPDNIALLERCASEAMGQDIRIKFGVSEDLAEEAEAQPEEDRKQWHDARDKIFPGASQAKKQDKSGFSHGRLLTDPIIQSALEIFKGKIITGNNR